MLVEVGLGLDLPEYDIFAGAITKNIEEIKKQIKSILPIIASVLGAIMAYKIATKIKNIADALGGLGTIGTVLKGVFVGLLGVITGIGIGSFIDWITNGNQEMEKLIKICLFYVS